MTIDPATLQSLTDAHIAILGKTGSGKSYAAKGIVEGLLVAGLPTCIIDPTGVWWGLRSLADGSDSGLPVVVLGGAHGDAALPPESGETVARLVAERRANVVVDTSELGSGESCRWFTAFADALFRLNSRPLRLVIDEAHQFAPQGRMADPQAGQMLHAANKLATGGRARGIRLLLLTQRPAQLHKNTLTQIDSLVAMRVTSPHDREAVEEWIKGAGDKEKAKEVLDSLAKMKRGEGWVWAPEHDILVRTTFPAIRTFDSSAAPRDGEERIAPRPVTPAGIAEIRAMLAPVPIATEAEDKSGKVRVVHASAEEILEARLQGRDEGRDDLRAEIEPRIDALRNALDELNALMRPTPKTSTKEVLERLGREGAFNYLTETPESDHSVVMGGNIEPAPRVVCVRPVPAPAYTRVAEKQSLESGSLGSTRRILSVLVERYPAKFSASQWATLAGVSRRSSTWRGHMAKLRAAGMIEEGDGKFHPSKAGLREIGNVKRAPKSPGEVVAMWKAALGEGPSRILDALTANPGRAINRERLASFAGVSPASSTFRGYMAKLNTNELIEKVGDGFRAAVILIEDNR